jgi:hypothetical protein
MSLMTASRFTSAALCLAAWVLLVFATPLSADSNACCCSVDQCASCATSATPVLNGCCPVTDAPSVPSPTAPCRVPEISCKDVTSASLLIRPHKHDDTTVIFPPVQQCRVMALERQRLCVFLI